MLLYSCPAPESATSILAIPILNLISPLGAQQQQQLACQSVCLQLLFVSPAGAAAAVMMIIPEAVCVVSVGFSDESPRQQLRQTIHITGTGTTKSKHIPSLPVTIQSPSLEFFLNCFRDFLCIFACPLTIHRYSSFVPLNLIACLQSNQSHICRTTVLPFLSLPTLEMMMMMIGNDFVPAENRQNPAAIYHDTSAENESIAVHGRSHIITVLACLLHSLPVH